MTSPDGAKTTQSKQSPSVLANISAGESEEFTRTHQRLVIQDYLPLSFHDGVAGAGKCEWSSHVAAHLTPEEAGALAWVLIDTMMKIRFGPAISLYDTWRQHTLAGTKIPRGDKETIASFIEPVFGLPGKPKSENHLHGHVGEWIWHLLTKDNAALRVQPDPKTDVTDGGADGFSIYENSVGDLRFRLWESKKNTGSGSLSSTLNKAYDQIATSGAIYVAKIVGTFSQVSNGASDELNNFIAKVPAAWAEGDELIGAGVTLATHQPLPGRPFEKMSARLPRLSKPGQLRGLVASISCYADLAEAVRRFAWTAL